MCKIDLLHTIHTYFAYSRMCEWWLVFVDPLYRTFVTIVEQNTLMRAAQVLHLTQPTITRQLQQLEAKHRTQLFDRFGKRLAMNRAGELVYEYAIRAIALEDKLSDELNEFTDPTRGTVYLGAGLTPSIYLLPELFATFQNSYPAVKFHVSTGSSSLITQSVLSREIDLGIVTTVREEPELTAIPLMRDDLRLVVPPSHPLVHAKVVSFDEVLRYPIILMKKGSGLRTIIVEYAEQRGKALVPVMETDSLESINRLVQYGMGIAFLPDSSVRDDIRAGRLVDVKLGDINLGSRTITLITASNRVLPACAIRFHEELEAYFSEMRSGV